VEGMEVQAGQHRVKWALLMVSARDTKSPEGMWGDPFKQKQKHMVRVYLQNIGGLQTHEEDKVKYTHLRQFIMTNKIDIIALLECSTNWGEMKYKQ